MIRILIITLFLSGCITQDINRVRQRATDRLVKAGYDVGTVTATPKITVRPSAAHVSGDYFNRTGEYKTLPGFYDAGNMEIVIAQYAAFTVWLHEYEHFLLHMLEIPIAEHHKIMNRL